MNRKGTAKVNLLKNIEVSRQSEWDKNKVFESNPNPKKEKYFVTFPYPYMNGTLHLGHAFSLSKCEFSMGYERLQGKETLWGFGLHCTGMPIKSSADKLTREMSEFGYPPNFPEESNLTVEVEKKEVGADKSKGKKSKAAAKSGGMKYQWQIMQSNGMSNEEIKGFTDPSHWLDYFPALTIRHLRLLGIKVDWRRSFITTDANPFYDSFVRWQFQRLKKSSKIMFGKRETIYSPRDCQPCMDHDRSSGEGVGPQEYTLIKIKLEKPYPTSLNIEDNVYMVAATLRPETMYGQTNCWIHPDLTYVAVKSENHGTLICVERSAKNMAYQEILSHEQGAMNIIAKLKGSEFIGCSVIAPLSAYRKIYVLPMMTIKESKGTGIVTSVPSDSPDDFAALRDLKKKPALREKYGISDDKVIPFEPLPIIQTEKYGNMCAPKTVEDMKIQSQNDSEKLELAKEECYKHGFYNGKLLVGQYAGENVETVKEKIKSDLIKCGDAIKYFEPERVVISRSGEACVVGLCDQWYLNYCDEQWKELTRQCLAQCNTFSKEVRNCFEATIERLHEYACSRSYGLGTRIPWDEQYLVESLSDSTIYMAYYTVAHYLQGDSLDGRGGTNKAEIDATEMTTDAWEYVLGEPATVETNLKETLKAKLDVLRREFLYWYPLDLRVSGKDLVPNHLTFCLFNHCAIWPNNGEQYWPKNIRANGHLLLNNDKMAKSTGNFLTIVDAIDKYSADGMRLALADSGDTVEDANFVEDMADAGVLRLYTFLEWSQETMDNCDQMRSGPLELHCDFVFEAAINRTIIEAEQHYKDMMFRRVVQVAFHEFQSARDRYRELSLGNCHRGLMVRFIEVQCLLLSPICPHLCDHIWLNVLGKSNSILSELWPVADQIKTTTLTEGAYVDQAAAEFRKKALYKPGKSKAPEPYNEAIIWIAKNYPAWQTEILTSLVSLASEEGVLPDNRALNKHLSTKPALASRIKKVMDFVQLVREKTGDKIEAVESLITASIDEARVLERNIAYIEKTLGLDIGRLDILYIDQCTDDNLRDSCCPMYPKITFRFVSQDLIEARQRSAVHVQFISPQLAAGLFGVDMMVADQDSVTTVLRLLAKNAAIDDYRVLALCPDESGPVTSGRFTVTNEGLRLNRGDNNVSVPVADKLKYIRL